MKTAAVFSSLVASTLAQGLFGVISLRSASPIHFLPLQANGGKFFLGGEPSSYCPPNIGDACKSLPGNSTVLAGGNGGLSLGVVVPGGQQVYIAPDGSMSYTVPHSAFKPEGSIVDGWAWTQNDNNIGSLTFTNVLLACPTAGGEDKPRQVYAKLPGLTFSPDCLSFSAATSNTTQASAWEY